MRKKKISLFIIIFLISLPTLGLATGQSQIDSGDTTFSIISTALVFLMTPGLALFYGGMVRKKNVLNTMMNSFIIIALVSVQWILFGYSVAFGPDKFHLFGDLSWTGFNNVGSNVNTDYANSIPHAAFAMYQLMFAIITPALITGAFAERMRFSAVIVFVMLWSTFVYDPLAHWVWGTGGWLKSLGVLDFAGGTVVHISSGISALVAALLVGKRNNHTRISATPHNAPLVILGSGLLWFGWFGFNAGSALSANGIAISALVTTNTAAASAMLSWVIIEYLDKGKPTLLGAITGAIVGLVAITPAAGYVTPVSSIIIGILVSPICYFAISKLKSRFGYDDALDAFGCHGIGGIWGSLATGIFATKLINPGGGNGLLYGNISQLWIQILSIVVTIIFSALLSYIIFKGISVFINIRVDGKSEDTGLDLSIHGEDAYPDFSLSSRASGDNLQNII